MIVRWLFFALAAVLLHSKVAIVSSGIEGARLWLSLQILEHAQLSPDLGRQMIDPGQSMVVGGWAELADKTGG